MHHGACLLQPWSNLLCVSGPSRVRLTRVSARRNAIWQLSAATLMMASRGLKITGSGTVSTRIFSFPSQQTARIGLLCCGSRAGNLAGFEQLLEVAQILTNGLRRFAAEER